MSVIYIFFWLLKKKRSGAFMALTWSLQTTAVEFMVSEQVSNFRNHYANPATNEYHNAEFQRGRMTSRREMIAKVIPQCIFWWTLVSSEPSSEKSGSVPQAP